MIISVCILAKNEADTIGDMLMQISRQTLLDRANVSVHIHVLANGCTDCTVREAEKCANFFDGTRARLIVHDIKQGGKSRTWNAAVHEIADPGTTYFMFIDPDVRLLSSTVTVELLNELIENPSLPVCGGYPVKDVLYQGEQILRR